MFCKSVVLCIRPSIKIHVFPLTYLCYEIEKGWSVGNIFFYAILMENDLFHVKILLTFIKLPFVIKIIVLSIF